MSLFAKEVNEYLSAIKNGDVTQLKPLFDLVGNHMSYVARYYLTDKSYCDDVTIEALQKIYQYINSYEDGKDGYNWICRIVQHVAYNYNEITAKHSGTTELASAATLADHDFVGHAEERIDLFQAIDRLDPESRELINLYFFLGKSFEEIGEELHLNKSSVKRRLDKILLKLRKLIETGSC